MLRFIASAAVCLVVVPSAHAARPSPGEWLGTVSIPAIHLKLRFQEEIANTEPGYYPVHYQDSAMPGDGWTVEIAAHHYTHALPGKDGGPFRHLDRLRSGQSIYIKMSPKFGGRTYRYITRKQVMVWCGESYYDIRYCPRSAPYFTNLARRQLILTTCIGNGDERRFVYADMQTASLRDRGRTDRESRRVSRHT